MGRKKRKDFIRRMARPTTVDKSAAEREDAGKSMKAPGYSLEKENNTGIPSELLGKFESAFDTDLSEVKVHKNSSEAEQLESAAFAKGNEIHFAKGIFDSHSQGGQKVIAHELAHLVQQNEGQVSATSQVNGKSINDSQTLEKSADQSAIKAVNHSKTSEKSSFNNSISANSAPQAAAQRLTLFAHGFLKDRDFMGNKNRKKHGEIMHGQDYNDYWGHFDESFAQRLGDSNQMFFDGSAGALSSAKGRQKCGKQAGYNFIHHLIAEQDPANAQVNFREVKMNENGQSKGNVSREATVYTDIADKDAHKTMLDDVFKMGMKSEPIVIVGHSMGAAFAAGMAQALKEYEFNLKAVYYVAPHQPKHIKHPAGVRGVQYSHKNDTVSSKGLVPFLSGSKLAKIPGVEYTEYDNPNLKGDWWTGGGKDAGGHYVKDHDYIFDSYEAGEEGYVAPTKKKKK